MCTTMMKKNDDGKTLSGKFISACDFQNFHGTVELLIREEKALNFTRFKAEKFLKASSELRKYFSTFLRR